MVLPCCIICFSALLVVINSTKKWIKKNGSQCQDQQCQSFGAMRNTLHGVHTHTTFIILDQHYSWPSTTVSTVTDMMVLRPPCCTPPSPTTLTSPVCFTLHIRGILFGLGASRSRVLGALRSCSCVPACSLRVCRLHNFFVRI